uniref:Epidermal patterning factor-like protein n=1 Tax=Nicotiana sylvestris TaxID=4096 RepID=A0A1U7VN17_NICSY|nr:PREDICTED: EPIDERMAL PATTERNING FACTOR-like protein 4 [Nicotiana sylvestris]
MKMGSSLAMVALAFLLLTTSVVLARDLNPTRHFGSSPPQCITKCGNCSPCTPVRIIVHPGISEKLEYYPEAWRCKCGNKLFNP